MNVEKSPKLKNKQKKKKQKKKKQKKKNLRVNLIHLLSENRLL